MALKGMTALCFLLLVGIVVCIAAMIRMGQEKEKTEEERVRYKQCLESMLLWFSRLRKDTTRCPAWYRVEDKLPEERGRYLAFISREAFIEQKRKLYCENCSRRKDSKGKTVYEIGDAPCRACGIGDVLDDLDDFPAADVRPVVRGRWVVSRTDYGWNGAEFPTHCKCTECGREVPYQDKDNFCPNCGADMREES